MKYFDDIEKIRDLAIMKKDEFLDFYPEYFQQNRQ